MPTEAYNKLWEACHALDWGDPARREILYIIYVARVKANAMVAENPEKNDQWSELFQKIIVKELFGNKSKSVVDFFSVHGIVN